MTHREVLRKQLEYVLGLDEIAQVRIIQRDVHNVVIAAKLIPITYLSNGDIWVEQSDIKHTSWEKF